MERNSKMTFKPIIAILILALTFSCSDSREQYDRSNDRSSEVATDGVVGIQGEGPTVGTESAVGTGGDNGTGLSTEEEDKRVRENRIKPIVYNTGAIAGITMNTTFEEAADILSTPQVFNTDSGSTWYVYKEGLQMIWRDNAPRVPILIFVTSDYEGTIDTQNEKYGKLFIGKDLSAQFGPEEERGESVLIDLYNNFHKMDDSYNCIKTTKCQIRYFAESGAILWMMPQLIIRVSSDRKQVADIRVVRDESSAAQDAPFDILKGEFTSSKGTLKLGQTYGDLIKFQDKETRFIDPSSNAMLAQYGNVYNVLTRSDYDRSYIKPIEAELIKGFYLSGSFENTFTINGRNVGVDINKESKELELFLTDEKKFLLTMKPSLDKNAGLKDLQLEFVDQLLNLVKDNMDPALGVIGYTSTGKQYLRDTDYLRSSIYQYDDKNDKGTLVSFSMDRIQGNLSFIETDLLYSPFNKFIAPGYFKSLSASKANKIQTYGSFSIGDTVNIKDIDLIKESATFSRGEDVERVNFNEYVTIKMANAIDNLFIEETVSSVGPSQFPFSLGVTKVSDGSYKVKMISFSLSYDQTLTLTCGNGELIELKFGDRDVDVKGKTVAAKSCRSVMENTTDGSNQLSTIYFPELRLNLSFDKNELSTVSVY